jgi:hypothetical protein
MKMINRTKVLAFGFASLLAFQISAGELLHMDFDDPAHLSRQPVPLPEGTLVGEVAPSDTFPGSAEFGPQRGLVRIQNFRSPQGPFSVEARFRIRSYGPESSRFVADILNTATWDNGPSQGFAFRIGGGYLYPPLPRSAYESEEEWLAASAEYSNIDRGRLSVCFAEFAMARQDDWRAWKEVVTDRCVERNAWTHMVAVWDGEDMRIYLNGNHASDQWRIQGKGHVPLLDSVADAFVGARTLGDWDPHHLDGQIDYVRVVDSVMSENEIHRRYNETFVPDARDSLCKGVLIPHSPAAGQVGKENATFEFKLIRHGACTDSDFVAAFAAGDSLEVEFAKDASFEDISISLVVGTIAFQLDPVNLARLSGYKGEIYWRARLIHHAPAGLAKVSAAPEEEWSPSRPMLLDLSAVSALHPGAAKLKPVRISS